MIEGQALPGAACAPDVFNTNLLMVQAIVDLFYADETDEPEKVAHALSICNDCPVQEQCLDANMSERHGIWGGTTESQRRALRQIVRMQ